MAGVGDALGFAIPNELLAVLGISIGSTAASTVVKAQKDATNPAAVAASDPGRDPPHFSQIFLVEEGPMADKVVDIAKYQNFWITLVLVVAYTALAVATINGATHIGDLKSLPGFSQGFLTLLLISHAGYLAGKLPTPPGVAPGMTYNMVEAKSRGEALPSFQPRRRVTSDRDAGRAPNPVSPS